MPKLFTLSRVQINLTLLSVSIYESCARAFKPGVITSTTHNH